MKKFFSVFAAVLVLILSACGGGDLDLSGTPDEAGNSDETQQEEEETTSNPIVQTQMFGQSGNIWKPSGDPHASGAGNLVVLLSAQFSQQFNSCELKKADGTTEQLLCLNSVPWTQTPFSCFSNGNRQTWRSSAGCSAAGEVKVTCYADNQEVVFTVPEAQRGAVCSRFG